MAGSTLMDLPWDSVLISESVTPQITTTSGLWGNKAVSSKDEIRRVNGDLSVGKVWGFLRKHRYQPLSRRYTYAPLRSVSSEAG